MAAEQHPAQGEQLASGPVGWEGWPWPQPWMAAFLATLSRLPNVSAACRTVGVGHSTVYRWRDGPDVGTEEQRADFARAWSEALAEAYDLLEHTMWRRAMRGEVREVSRTTTKTGPDGKVVDRIEVVERENVVSDGLLVQLAKAYRPGRFRERVDHRHTGGDGTGPVQHEVVTAQPRTVERLAKLLAVAARERLLELPAGVPEVVEHTSREVPVDDETIEVEVEVDGEVEVEPE